MIILFTFLSLFAHADAPFKKILKVGPHHFSVIEVRPSVWVNESCSQTCDALRAVDQMAKMSARAINVAGGVNPGSWRCKMLAHGNVFIAQDEAGNQQSFCRFKDASFVNNGALKTK
jgi:hypothetical protein